MTVYVHRDSNNQIVSVSLEETPDHRETLPSDAPELAAFVGLLSGNREELVNSDLGFVRVLEDLVDLLMERDVVRFTDFPEAAQQKFLARRTLRSSMRSLNLLGKEDDEDGLV